MAKIRKRENEVPGRTAPSDGKRDTREFQAEGQQTANTAKDVSVG